MSKRIYQEKKIWLILLAGLVILLSSCKKELEEDELGPAVTKTEFVNLFSQVVESLDVLNINNRQWVFSYQYGLFLGQPISNGVATQIDVYNLYDSDCGDTESLGLDYFEVQQRTINGKTELFEWDKKACFQKDKLDLLWSYYAPIIHGEGVLSTIHNLKMNIGKQQAPKAIVDNGCPLMSSCEIRVFDIEYYENILYPDGESERRFHQYKISPDVPFLARDLVNCITQSLEIDNTMVSVKQCNEVRNFGERSE